MYFKFGVKKGKEIIRDSLTTFARPKSASFTDPVASTKIFAHLISLKEHTEIEDSDNLKAE